MPADFPNNPAVGDTFTGTNGATYTWDGVKWVNTGCGTGALDNLIAGTCITLPKNGNQVTVNASIPCIQTPWLQDENASGFRLMNASLVQTPAVSAPPSNSLDLTGFGNIYFTVNSSAPMSLTPNSVLVNNTISNPTSDLTISSSANLLFSSGGSERMRVTPAGYVGIGTVGPITLLDIMGANQPVTNPRVGQGALRIASSASLNANCILMGVDDSLIAGWIQSVTPGVSNRNLLLNADGGNVGIGTSTPLTMLHVNGPIHVSGYSTAINNPNSVTLDNFNGTSRLISFGPDTTTLGAFQFIEVHSDNSGTSVTMTIDANANVNIHNSLYCNDVYMVGGLFGPVGTNSTPMLFAGNADPGAGMDAQTLCIWADITNSRMVLDFKTAAGTVVRGYVPVS